MKKLIVGILMISVLLFAYFYFSDPYKGCKEISVGDGFVTGYDCDDKSIYIPKR